MPSHRRRIVALAVTALLAPLSTAFTQTASLSPWVGDLRDDAARLIRAATADDSAWQRLAMMTDMFGARLSGSDNLTRAIDWAAETMKADGFENVRKEPVMVPRWIRGRESAEIIDPPRHQVAMLGLGGTVATPPGGLEADILLVN